jgi:hypothetical protein
MTPTGRVVVDYQETGGSPGVTLRSHLSTADAADPDTATLESLVRNADLFSGRMLPHIAPAGATWYDLHVTLDGKVVDWRLNDAQVWPELRPLLDYLHQHAG